MNIKITFFATLVVLLTTWSSSEAKMTNSSCPKTEPWSHNADQNQGMLPWNWDLQDWNHAMGAIAAACQESDDPELEAVAGIYDVASAMWKFFGGFFHTSNTNPQIMEEVYALVKQEIDEEVLDELNSKFDDAGYWLSLYHNKTYNRCQYLVQAEAAIVDAASLMHDYTVDDPSHIFLNHWARAASLHVGIFREMYYNASDPTVCCYPYNDPNTNQQVCEDSDGDDLTAETVYNQYYNNYTIWLPQWYDWRVSSDNYEVHYNGKSFSTKDKITSQECSGSAPTNDKDYNHNYAYGTLTAMANEAVAYMLANMNVFSTMHRLVPGHEKDAPRYEPADAQKPLGFFRTGIWVGPYRLNDETLVGMEYVEQDTPARVEALKVGTHRQSSQSNKYVYGVEVDYTNGVATNHGSTDVDWWTTFKPEKDGWIQWVSGFTDTNVNSCKDSIYGMQAGYKTNTTVEGQEAYSISEPTWGASCGYPDCWYPDAGVVNVSIADDFGMVAWGDNYAGAGCDVGSPIGSIMAAFVPQVNLADFDASSMTDAKVNSRRLRGSRP